MKTEIHRTYLETPMWLIEINHKGHVRKSLVETSVGWKGLLKECRRLKRKLREDYREHTLAL